MFCRLHSKDIRNTDRIVYYFLLNYNELTAANEEVLASGLLASRGAGRDFV